MKNKAIKYFEKEIQEINTLLKGSVSDRYRECLNERKTYFDMAVVALSNLEDIIEDK